MQSEAGKDTATAPCEKAEGKRANIIYYRKVDPKTGNIVYKEIYVPEIDVSGKGKKKKHLDGRKQDSSKRSVESKPMRTTEPAAETKPSH
ncbi:hypothetical protein ElyMa_006685900 [Elysia marginata]|uniref:MBD domain-containing protein n=1 Tax=Elysia marginata TaxID=1093978 RepID=A0AAV4INZ8_9GAST|nr:hypothetical protein ElyMa_006685900 [Elysia marginata]